jgi:hypothetical protein
MKRWSIVLTLAALLLLVVCAQAQDEPIIEQGDVPIEELEAPAEEIPADEPVEEDSGFVPEEEYAEPEQTEPIEDGAERAPSIPALDEVLQGKAVIREYIPLDVNFRVGLVGEFIENVATYDGGSTSQTKSPLILLDPRTGGVKVHARNFPARIVANAENGQWVIAIADSAAVEGTSGSASKEAAVSLNMQTGEIKLITEFPLHSKFQAIFLDHEKDTVLYCVNEPGVVNQIIRFNLQTREGTPLPAEGNRFYMYGLRETQGRPTAIWVRDPKAVTQYPVASLLDLTGGQQIDRVEFPGTTEIMARPDGSHLLATIVDRGEASLGYYDVGTHDFKQIDDLVLTKPQIKWTHNGKAIIVKESTTTKDRFLWVDLETGQPRELFSAYFKITEHWDISPNDDALVFIVKSGEVPVLFVLPLDPSIKTINRIKLRDMTNVTWLGCLNTPQGAGGGGSKSWLDKLIPKF